MQQRKISDDAFQSPLTHNFIRTFWHRLVSVSRRVTIGLIRMSAYRYPHIEGNIYLLVARHEATQRPMLAEEQLASIVLPAVNPVPFKHHRGV